MSFWKTEGADDMLKKLRSEGKSFGQIAAEISFAYKLKVTRNACISRASRNGMSPVNIARKPSIKRRASSRTLRKRGPLSTFLASSIPMSDIDTPADDVAKVSLLDLERHHCRYPIGTPGTPGFGFCGDHHIPGLSYCERHAIRCMVPETVRTERRREFVLRKIGIGAARELRTALEDA